jgi:hypothetical protein
MEMTGSTTRIQSIATLGLLALAACTATEPSAPLLPNGAVAISAPAEYQAWFNKTEGCASISGAYSTIKFYVVPNVSSFTSEFGETVALWRKHNNDNVIVISGNYQADEMVVRHEMLHALLQVDGHPVNYFVTDCHLTWDSWASNQTSAYASASTQHAY